MTTADEERIALFLDYENLAIGAREDLSGMRFDLKPLADALAERGRVVVRRAYADWSYFDEDRRMLTQQHVELIEIPQRMGAVRKNAADIKMAVDAVELSFERGYITTFVICTGDSDFTPLVDKLRSLNKRVIGVGLQASTSALLPPACDEFLFYERLEGVDVPERKRRGGGGGRGRGTGRGRSRGDDGRGDDTRGGKGRAPITTTPAPTPDEASAEPVADSGRTDTADGNGGKGDTATLGKLVTQTLSGLQRSSGGEVLASMLKRAILRKDPTFNEADYGFRAFGELLRHLEGRRIVELSAGAAKGDPEVSFPEAGSEEDAAFDLLRDTVVELQAAGGPPPLSGLKNELRKRRPDFSEKSFGFGGFLQFCKAARTRGLVNMEWNDEVDDYVLEVAEAAPQT
ncbi:hypothetical protein BH23ACT8_BH23ACT8_13980 [soil metagenome]